jgi:hypothetical protein
MKKDYIKIPLDYLEDLLEANRDKALAFTTYCIDKFKGRNNKQVYYSKRWNKPRSTIGYWIKEFDAVLEKEGAK